MTRAPANGVDPSWLGLRGPADVRARTTFTGDLTAGLARHLTPLLPDGGAARLVDVGAGMGAGARWLRERLPVEQDWRLVDRDPAVLAATPDSVRRWARDIVAGVEDLAGLLAEEPAHVVTCQALLDVLTTEEIDALLAATATSHAAALLSLSVTGQVVLSPPHPADDLVAEAFDEHQRRGGRRGPDGGGYAAEMLRRHGYAVTTVASPWHLGAADDALMRTWLDGRAAAAEEQEPDLSPQIRRWRESREATAGSGELSAVVGHVDVLALPRDPRRSA